MATNLNGNGAGLSKVFLAVLGTVIAAAIIASTSFTVRASVTQAVIDEKIANLVASQLEWRARVTELERDRATQHEEIVRLQAKVQRLEERR